MRRYIRQLVGISLLTALIILAAGGDIYSQNTISDGKPILEIKIINTTDEYFLIDVGLGIPIRINRKDIKHIAERFHFDVGQQFKLKNGSGEPVDVLFDKKAVEKIDKAGIDTSEKGLVMENFVFGKIVFKDFTPPKDNFYKFTDEQFSLNQQLIEAVKNGNTFNVLSSLQQGADPNARRNQRHNKAPNQQTILNMLNSNDPNAKKIAADLSVNAYAEANNETALLYAARKGYIDIAKILLKAGADPDINTSSGSPISEAVRYRKAEMVRLLRAHSKLPPSKNPLFSPLQNNVLWEDPLNEQKTFDTIKALIETGSDINALNNHNF